MLDYNSTKQQPEEWGAHLDEAWLEGKPHGLSVMLGREDFLGSTTVARGSADYALIPRSFNWAKT